MGNSTAATTSKVVLTIELRAINRVLFDGVQGGLQMIHDLDTGIAGTVRDGVISAGLGTPGTLDQGIKITLRQSSSFLLKIS